MRLERIWAQQEKDRQVAEALAKFAAMQSGLKKSEKVEKAAAKQSQEEMQEKDEHEKAAEKKKAMSNELRNRGTKMVTGRIEGKKQAVQPAPKSMEKAGRRPPVGKKAKAAFKTGSLPQNKPVKAN